MQKIHSYLYACIVFLTMAGSYSCSSPDQNLRKRQEYAERRTEMLCDALVRNASLDSIRTIAEKDDDLFFYIFDAYQMVYWSSNRLVANADAVYLYTYDTWREMSFLNAQTSARWTKAGMYNVLTIIPVSYSQLGDYDDLHTVASQTFSFRAMVESDKESDKHSWLNSKLYYYLIIALFGLIILVGIAGWIRHRGIRNMRISTRIMYIIFIPILAVFIYIFLMAIGYVRGNFVQRQRRGLEARSEYVQSFLRSQFGRETDYSLEMKKEYLGVELHDLGIDMNQDIHVYSMSGELLASSSEALFSSGLLSRRMAPEARYCESYPTVCYEYIASHPYLVAYIPFYNGYFNVIGYIAVPYFMSEQTRDSEVDALLSRLLPPYLIVLIVLLFFSYLAARSMTAPVSMLNEKMRQFKIGAKNNHITYPYHDELGALVERYNMLVDKVEESAEQLARAERESAWRTMARQIAHEISNPLTPMKLSVQKLQLKRGKEGFDEYFDKTTRMLIAEIDNLAHIAQSFSAFAKQPEVVTTEVDIAEKLSNVITLQRANDEHIPVRYVGADAGVVVLADQEQIAQVFVNILKNALQASPTDIIVVLNASYSEREVQISVSDDGTGIPADIQAKIFRPNFTTKSNGNGLGLAISKHIVEGSGGRIEFETSDKGTTFFVYLRKKQADN